MVLVLLVKPAGLFGQGALDVATHRGPGRRAATLRDRAHRRWSRPRSWRCCSPSRRSSASIPVFLMKALCFALFACAFNLLIGFGGLLSFGHAMFLGTAGYVCAHAAKDWGLPPELAILARHARADGARRRRRRARDPPPGHLLRDDHARARADDLLLLPAGAVHARRGRHPGGAARQAVRLHRPVEHARRCTTSCWSSSCSAFLLIYRVVHSPFGQVLKAIRENEPRAISLGYDADRYKLLAFVLSADARRASRARPRRSCSSSRR